MEHHLEVDLANHRVCIHDIVLEQGHEWRLAGMIVFKSLLVWCSWEEARHVTWSLEVVHWDVDLADDSLVLDELVNVPEDEDEAPVLQGIQVVDWCVDWRYVFLLPGDVVDVTHQRTRLGLLISYVIPFLRLLT